MTKEWQTQQAAFSVSQHRLRGYHADMNRERVYAIWDYHDSPREGVADFQGRPHMFKCQFSDVDDDWTDLFWLMEVDQEISQAAEEQSALFLRWSAEFKRGTVSIDSYPALPEDPSRYAVLEDILRGRPQLQPEHSAIRRGRFIRSLEGQGTEVEWTVP